MKSESKLIINLTDVVFETINDFLKQYPDLSQQEKLNLALGSLIYFFSSASFFFIEGSGENLDVGIDTTIEEVKLVFEELKKDFNEKKEQE